LILIILIRSSAFSQAIYAENQIPARGVEIAYEVTIKNPVSHIYDVQVDIRGLRTTSIDLSMPAWEPGAYSIRDHAKNVQDFRAQSRNQPLPWKQTDKQTWRISKQTENDVVVRYQVFSNRLTDEMADISGPALFMYVVGQKHVPVSVKYNAPNGWETYTALEKRGDRYHAGDYDIFIDAPAFIGDHFRVLDFEVNNIPHRMVFSKSDFSLIDQQVISNSTRITVGEHDFVSQVSYRRFLFVVAHEYFHLWNVKRIRPKVLGPFDYTREVNTRLLWVSEGLTSYYADLLLVRANIATPTEFFDKVGTVINTIQHAPGRLLMSAEEASWNTWLRSDNANNNTISYYDKGQLIGMLLDIEIRSRTRNEKSLDDVMRYLMANYADKGVGFSEDGFLNAVEAVAGSDFKEFFQINVESRKELDYERYVKAAGLQISVAKQPGWDDLCRCRIRTRRHGSGPCAPRRPGIACGESQIGRR
jgi:predicted metalloprotease with PDZ domain